MISHVGKEMKWFKLGESWWGLCQSDGVRAPSQTGRLRSFPRDTMICETFVCWQLVYVLHPVVCIGCIFSGVWTSFVLNWLTWAAVGTRTTQVLLQTRQPLQVDWGRPFSERDGSIYSSPIPPLSFRQNGTLFVLVSILKPVYTKPFRLMSWCLFYRLVACKPGPYLFPKKMSLETAPTSLQSRTSRYTQNHADMNWNALGIYIDMLDI